MPLDSVEGIRRVLEAAVLDVLPLEPSVARARTLIAAALAAARLLGSNTWATVERPARLRLET